MLELVVAVNDEGILDRNLMRSPLLKRPGVSVHFRKGFSCAGKAYNSMLVNAKTDWLVFLHQDVFIPVNWQDKVHHAIRSLEEKDPNWAVLGVYGVKDQGQHVGHLWCSGCNKILGSHFESPEAVGSLDEVLIIVRRSAGISFDEGLPGFHLYGTDIVQSAIDREMGTYAVCAPVIHNSRPVLFLGGDYFAAYKYVSKKWSMKLPVHSTVETIERSGLSFARKRVRNLVAQVRHLNVSRNDFDRNYDPVALAGKLGF